MVYCRKNLPSRKKAFEISHRHFKSLIFFLFDYFVEAVRFGTYSKTASIVEIAMYCTHIVYGNYSRLSSRLYRAGVVTAHAIKLHSCTRRVLLFQLFNSSAVRKNHLPSLSATHFL